MIRIPAPPLDKTHLVGDASPNHHAPVEAQSVEVAAATPPRDLIGAPSTASHWLGRCGPYVDALLSVRGAP